MNRTTKKTILYVGGALLLLGAIKGYQIYRAISANAGFMPPPEAVTSIITKQEVWPDTYFAVGSLAATQGVTMAMQESGVVSEIRFNPGDRVEAGTVLVTLDTSVEESQLQGAEARLADTDRTLRRAQELRKANAMAQSEADTAIAVQREARAAVDALRNTIARKRIIAPFTGYTGIRMVNVGQFLNAGTPSVPIYSLDPLYINFSLPQQAVGSLKPGLPLAVTVDSFAGVTFNGTVTAVNPQVDVDTRTVGVQGTMANPAEQLRPGMFAEVVVSLPTSKSFITIPSSSIAYAPSGDSVYVIEKAKDPTGADILKVRKQIVKLGEQRGNQVAVLSGLKDGEEVVTSGTFKLRPDAAVVVNNSFAPANDPAPTVKDT